MMDSMGINSCDWIYSRKLRSWESQGPLDPAAMALAQMTRVNLLIIIAGSST